MDKLTHDQYLILEKIYNEKTDARKKDSDEDIESIWELVRAGYLNNFPLLGGNADWRFSLTDKGINHIKNTITK